MSLPVSKLVWGIGEAPVTGAWMPMTISSSLTPAASLSSGSYGPAATAVSGVDEAGEAEPGTDEPVTALPGVAPGAA
ncbi:MAG: hypothetical protein H0W46_00085, partial [Acidimicrobiia bacterium]|nr:hypothetical protein [Acidimicrobiia bacterium]